MENSKILSNMIMWLRVPLTILVIFVHTDVPSFDEKNTIIISWLFAYIRDVIVYVSSLAVPTFFVISGYLFFRNIKVLSLEVLINKFRNRIYSLVIPFLFWNLMVFVWTLFIYCYKNEDQISISAFINDYSLYHIFISSRDYGSPIYMIMWYVRDLIALTMLSPIFYYAIKYLKVFFLAFSILLYLSGGGSCWLGYLSIAFFTLGAYVGIMKINVISLFSRKYLMGMYSLVLLISYMLYHSEILPVGSLRLLKVLGVVYLFYIAYFFVKRGAKNYQLASSASFFIYCTHILQPANNMTILSFSIFALSNTIGLVPYIGDFASYILSPFCTFAICLTLYVLLQRLFPRFIKIITGLR